MARSAAVLVLLGLITGCGSSAASSPRASGGVTTSASASASPSLSQSQPSSQSAPAISTTCGAATLRGSSVVLAGSAALSCFRAALATCTSASIQVSELSVDVGRVHTLTILGGSPCRVRDVHTMFVAPHPPSAPVTDVCTGTQAQGASIVLLGCGTEGDLTLPPPS